MTVPDDRGPEQGWPSRWTSQLPAFLTFHVHAADARDDDPVAPVLGQVAMSQDWDVERVIWAVLTYMAYDDLGSALAVLSRHQAPAVPADDLLALPCSPRRRAHRQPERLRAHFASIEAAASNWGGLFPWLVKGVQGLPTELTHEAVGRWVRRLVGNGPWAAHRTVEILAAVLTGWAAEVLAAKVMLYQPPGLGAEASTGPASGLALLVHGFTPQATGATGIRELDAAAGELQILMGRFGIFPPRCQLGRTLGMFAAMHRGRGYVGHEIDTQQAQLNATPSDLTAAAFKARAAQIPFCYRGEHSGWDGPRAARRSYYRRQNRVVVSTPDGDATALSITSRVYSVGPVSIP